MWGRCILTLSGERKMNQRENIVNRLDDIYRDFEPTLRNSPAHLEDFGRAIRAAQNVVVASHVIREPVH